MAITGVAGSPAPYQTLKTEAAGTAKQTASTQNIGTQQPPQKAQTDTVSISPQARALQLSSKTYSPAEEAREPTAERVTEQSRGQK